MGLTGVHHPNSLHHFNGVTHCPWCGKERQNKGTIINHLQMTHYKLGLVCKNASAVHWSHLRPSSAMATRTASHLQKKALTNHLHPPNHKPKVCQININTSKMWTWMEDQMGNCTSIELTHQGYPCPTNADLDGRLEKGSDINQMTHQGHPCPISMDLDGGPDAHQMDAHISSQSSCILLRLE